MVRFLMILAMVGAAATGCGPKTRAARVAPEQAVDLSGKWNDADARETAQVLADGILAGPWLTAFRSEQGRKPAIRVRGLVNKTDEHIDAQVFIKSIEAALINSAQVTVLAQEGNELTSVRKEQAYGLSDAVAVESAAAVGQETGADFVVAVRLASVSDRVDGRQVKLYKISFELIDPSSGAKAWVGNHEIKKLIERADVSW